MGFFDPQESSQRVGVLSTISIIRPGNETRLVDLNRVCFMTAVNEWAFAIRMGISIASIRPNRMAEPVTTAQWVLHVLFQRQVCSGQQSLLHSKSGKDRVLHHYSNLCTIGSFGSKKNFLQLPIPCAMMVLQKKKEFRQGYPGSPDSCFRSVQGR